MTGNPGRRSLPENEPQPLGSAERPSTPPGELWDSYIARPTLVRPLRAAAPAGAPGARPPSPPCQVPPSTGIGCGFFLIEARRRIGTRIARAVGYRRRDDSAVLMSPPVCCRLQRFKSRPGRSSLSIVLAFAPQMVALALDPAFRRGISHGNRCRSRLQVLRYAVIRIILISGTRLAPL